MSSLKKYELEEAAVLHLKDGADELMYADGADGQPDTSKPMRVHLYGPGTQQYARAQNARQNHQVDLLKRKGKTRETAEEAALEQAEFLAACTKSMENMETESGNAGRDLFVEVYANRRLYFIATQVGLFLNDTANFTQGSRRP